MYAPRLKNTSCPVVKALVRVHTDTQSNTLNQTIQAKAFTTGQDVFFKRGAY
ncbi:MAG TPA: hypothetical protein DD761_09375, partial [Cyanobacteria bacterium UBA11691]|nr:hypothetical protein [Cyanobacteria bacterium UBA11691]